MSYKKCKDVSPVGCKFLTYKASWNLCDDVAPEEGAVDHPYCFRVPGELCRLKKGVFIGVFIYKGFSLLCANRNRQEKCI